MVLVASCSFGLCLIIVVFACQIEAKLYRARPVYAGALLSKFHHVALLSQLLYLN